jgi:F0F1-type ATP synthase membrane subunit c/vacuolar-type H+-ATPase subunit K
MPFFIATGTITLAALGASSAIGYVGSRSCYEIAKNPEHYSIFLRTTLLAFAFIESTVVYALIVGFFLIFRVSSF